MPNLSLPARTFARATACYAFAATAAAGPLIAQRAIAAFFDQYLKDGLRTGASARVAEAK